MREQPDFIQAMTPIDSYAEADEVLKSADFESGHLERESLEFRGETLIDLDGEAHMQRRRLHARLFTRSSLRRYESALLAPALDEAFETLRCQSRAGRVIGVDLTKLVRGLMARLTVAIVGLDGVNTEEQVSRLLEYAVPLNDALIVRWATRDHNEVIEAGLIAKRRFIAEFVQPSIKRRQSMISELRAGSQPSAAPDDLIALTLFEAGDGFDQEALVRECILYLVAGIFSPAGAIVQAVDELDEWLRRHPSQRHRVADPEFLKRVVHEALRDRATIPALIRRAVRNTILSTGRRLRAGEYVAFRHDVVDRDTTVFGLDAAEFNPSRQLASDTARPYGLTFGAGVKACIAKPLVVTSSGPADADLDRLLVRVMRVLYEHGIVVDRLRGSVRAATNEERFDVFPVRFENLFRGPEASST